MSLSLTDSLRLGGGSAHRRAAFRWQQSYTRCFLHPEKALGHSRCSVWVVPIPGGIQTSCESFQKPADLKGFPAVLWSYVFLADPNVLATQPLLPGWGSVITCPQSAAWLDRSKMTATSLVSHCWPTRSQSVDKLRERNNPVMKCNPNCLPLLNGFNITNTFYHPGRDSLCLGNF